MRTRVILYAALLALALAPVARAADPADLTFWQSVSQSRDPGEFQAYLKAFPHGQFAALAKIKLEELRGSQNRPQQPQTALASIEVTHPQVRAVDRIEFDVDASNLSRGSNYRLIVVPASTPDNVPDPTAFARVSTPITAQMLHMTLPPASPGNDQIRLLYIPQFGNHFVVAARASVHVLPASPGAMTTGQLLADAKLNSALRFEAKYRDRAIKLEGQFLRVETRTTWGGWDLAGRYHDPSRYVEMYMGAMGTPDRENDAPTEVMCLMLIDNSTMDRLARLNPGNAVVVSGTPTTWGSYFGSYAVTFDGCRFAQ